jgi:alkylation response protein AidB-like acyl-CoA dehydrogenase
MNFTPTPQQLEWQERARRLARETLAPRADEADDRRVFQHAALNDLRRAGFLSLAVPEWHGGQWVDHVTYALVMEALGEGDASLTCCLAMHFGCTFHILSAGDREQKERWLGRIVREGAMLAVASTDARPDEEAPPGLVHATPVEGGYRLNGRKYFVTGAGVVDAFITRAEREEGGALNCAVPARDNPGVRVVESWDGMGLRASSTNDVIFEECLVPAEDVLGVCPDPEPLCFQPTAGFSIGLTAWPLGVARAAYTYARRVLRRESEKAGTGRPVSQEKRRLLARMHLDIETAHWLLIHAAWMADTQPERYLMPLQAARYAATEGAVRVTHHALLAVGGRGYLERNPLARLLRDAQSAPLQAACHEQCLERVATELLRDERG